MSKLITYKKMGENRNKVMWDIEIDDAYTLCCHTYFGSIKEAETSAQEVAHKLKITITKKEVL